MRKGVVGLGILPPPVRLKKSRSRNDDSTNAIGTEPGDKRRNSLSWERVRAVAIQVQAMARAATCVASATCEGGALEAVGHTELAIGLMWADIFCGENRGLAADCVHEVNGGCERALLTSGRSGVGEKELTS